MVIDGLAVLIWFIVGRGLRPLEQLALAVRERNPELLHPIPEAHLPAELKPLAMALNDLLQRLDRAMKNQRDFVADAAHELRTPLTALQLQAQLAERAGTDAERTLGFSYLREGLKRATQLVQQLLMLARQEAGVTHTLLARIDLSSLVTNVISEHAPLAQAKGIELRVNAEGAYDVRGDANALRIMISNVIDNAVQYTPQMGAIDVVLSRKDGRSTLDISDTGPGIPGEERLRVFDRFYRREGSAGPGSGLGLAIVKRIADTHGVETLLSDRLSGAGLRIRFTFPRIAS